VKYYLQFKITFKYCNFFSSDPKLNFWHHYSSLQCHMILQKSL